jgi:hypothetical protein
MELVVLVELAEVAMLVLDLLMLMVMHQAQLILAEVAVEIMAHLVLKKVELAVLVW